MQGSAQGFWGQLSYAERGCLSAYFRRTPPVTRGHCCSRLAQHATGSAGAQFHLSPSAFAGAPKRLSHERAANRAREPAYLKTRDFVIIRDPPRVGK